MPRSAHFASITLAAGSLLALAPAQAETILFDFGDDGSFRGASVVNPDLNGSYWNSEGPGVPILDAVTTTNGSTLVDLYFDTGVGTDSYNGPAGPTDVNTVADTDIDNAALGLLGADAAGYDFAVGTQVRFQLQQLNPNNTYDLIFFGSRKYQTDAETVYTTYDDNAYSSLTGSATLAIHDGLNGNPQNHNRDTVATISSVSPGADGIIYVQFTGSGGNAGVLNAFSVTGDFNPVPTPASLPLVGLGMLAATRRRRA